ncbi:MAG: hypothetical protein RMJ48_07465 [Roseiflexaceae bacterium]|nr:hypothetical protein [Roseiflexaceae bacterium]
MHSSTTFDISVDALILAAAARARATHRLDVADAKAVEGYCNLC